MPRHFLQQIFCGVALTAAASSVPAARAFDAGSVNALCLAGFNTAMTAAGKTAPKGMAEYTCSCFSTRLQQGQSIDQARTACREAAAQKFTVK